MKSAMRSASRLTTRAAVMVMVVAALLLSLTALPAGAAPSGATPSDAVDRAVDGLRNGRLHLDPGQNQLSGTETDRVRRALDSAASPVYLAVLPPVASEREADALPKRIGERVRRNGTYAVLAGDHLAAASTQLGPGTAMRLAAEATNDHQGDVAGGLVAFVGDVQAAAGDGGSARNGEQGEPRRETSPGSGLILPILLVGGGAAAFLLVRRSSRNRRRRQAEELAQVRTVVDEDITSYGEDLDRLDFDPSGAGVDDAMRADYGRALDAYENAKRAIAAARGAEDARTVTAALEEGRFALASLAARREGRPLPERRPPCFFDPRHGPSVQDAEWAPGGGMPRQVPVCAADAARLADRLDPMVRQVEVAGGGRRPYWDAGPAYGPWAGGYFGGYGSMLLPGLLVGTVLGSSFSAPGWFSDQPGDQPGTDAGDFGDSDFGGGGDFGGF